MAGREAVWAELARRDATVAVVAFSGRAGAGGTTGSVTLRCLGGQDLVRLERWKDGELALALEGPVWDRYGQFAGHPLIRGTVSWLLAERCILISGRRGGESFEERLT
ncbi:MAG: hypothetical protein ACLP8S_13285 [Solirubrobacteraceae bacterium]